MVSGTYSDTVHTISELPLRSDILGSELVIDVLFINVLHLSKKFTLVIIFVTVVIESSPNVAVTLLAGFPSSGGLCILVSEGRKPNSAGGLQGAEAGKV